MTSFALPSDLVFNQTMLTDPSGFARDHQAASWLCPNGEEFASMEGGMSYAQARDAVAHAVHVITDPPHVPCSVTPGVLPSPPTPAACGTGPTPPRGSARRRSSAA